MKKKEGFINKYSAQLYKFGKIMVKYESTLVYLNSHCFELIIFKFFCGFQNVESQLDLEVVSSISS